MAPFLLHAGTQDGDRLRLLNQGLLDRSSNGAAGRGHHYVTVRVIIPQLLDLQSKLETTRHDPAASTRLRTGEGSSSNGNAGLVPDAAILQKSDSDFGGALSMPALLRLQAMQCSAAA